MIVVIFTLLFLNVVIFVTLYFKLLDQTYLFKSFERNSVYQKIPGVLAKTLPNDPNLSFEEKFTISAIAPNIPSSFVKDAVEKNTLQILDFIHGRTNDIVITFPSFDKNLAGKNTQWSLSKNAPVDFRMSVEMLHGAGSKLFAAIIFETLVLFALIIAYGRTDGRLFGSAPLFYGGGILLFLSVFLKFFIPDLAGNLSKGPEPSQAILGLVVSSLLPDIINLWLVISVFVILFGIVILVINRRSRVVQ